MKSSNILLILIVLVIGSCSSEQGTVSTVNTIGAGYPEGAVVHDYEGLPGRARVILYNGGRIIGEGDYLNQNPEGTWTDYSNSGLVIKVTNFLNGQQHGVTLSYDDRNGQIASKQTYNRGVLHGQSLTYQNLVIVDEKNYENGELNGTSKKFYTNGNIQEEMPYVNGTIHGVASWYNEAGELLYQYEYDNGSFVKDISPTSDGG